MVRWWEANINRRIPFYSLHEEKPFFKNKSFPTKRNFVRTSFCLPLLFCSALSFPVLSVENPLPLDLNAPFRRGLQKSRQVDDPLALRSVFNLLHNEVKDSLEGAHEEFYTLKRTLERCLRDDEEQIYTEEVKKEIEDVLRNALPPPFLVMQSLGDGERFRIKMKPTREDPALLPLENHLRILRRILQKTNAPLSSLFEQMIVLYEQYADTICAYNPEERSRLLEKTVRVDGPLSSFLISSLMARRALMTDEFGYSVRREHPGVHSVQGLGNVFFKSDSGLAPLHPGVEISASLLQTLVFRDLAINPVSLFKINQVPTKRSANKTLNNSLQQAFIDGTHAFLNYFAKNPTVVSKFVDGHNDYIVQTSLLVPERDFEKFLELFLSNKMSLEAFVQAIHKTRYSSLYLSSLLLIPSDYKADNFRIDETGVLTAIDSDHMFGSPVTKARDKYYVGLKSILFGLPVLPDHVLHEDVRTMLEELSPELVILQWLQALREHNQEYGTLGMTDPSLKWGIFDHTGAQLSLPIDLSPLLPEQLKQRLWRLKELLVDNTICTHDQFFCNFYQTDYPIVHEVYQILRHRFPNNPKSLMEAIYTQDIETILERDLTSTEKEALDRRILTSADEVSQPEESEAEDSEHDERTNETRTNNRSINDLIQTYLNQLDLSQLSLRRYLKEILTFITETCYKEGFNATHPSWNYPDLLWHLYDDKASECVFSFLQDRQPGVFEDTRDRNDKTILHRVLEEWDPLWSSKIFDILINSINDYEMCDNSGRSLLDLACEYRHTTPFRILVAKGAGKHIRPSLGVKFYKYLLTQQRADSQNEEIRTTLATFKILEQRNRDLKFRMAIEHILGGVLTEEVFPLSSLTMINQSAESKMLPQRTVDQLFDVSTTRVRKFNKYGRGTVAKATHDDYTLYFKFFPEIPGIEAAVSLLTHDLIGFGTSKSELFKIPHSIQVPILRPSFFGGERLVEEIVQNVPVLVSLGIEGKTLKEVFEDPVARTDVLQNLDQNSLYAMILVAMLTNPEDGKSDNYIVEPFITSEGQQKYRLIGVDNDHAFVPALAETTRTRVRINTKTILYAFDEITKPVPEAIRAIFKAIDVNKLLRNWLSGLSLLNSQYASIFDNSVHNRMLMERYQSFIGIPFAPDAISRLYTKITKLQQTLKDSSKSPRTLTPLNLFMKIEPVLKGRYGEVLLRLKEMSPFERFRLIEGGAADTTFSRPLDILTSYQIPNDPQNRQLILENRQHGPGQARMELEEIIRQTEEFDVIKSGQVEVFRQLKRGDHIETLLSDMDFNTLSLTVNDDFLKAIQEKLPLITKLTLNNHKSFKTANLKSWSEDVWKRLTYVTLSGCQGIHEGGITYLSEKAENLEYLDLSRSDGIKTIAIGRASPLLSFKSLKYLDVSECSQLSHIDLYASSLKRFTINQCPVLTNIRLVSPSCKTVVATNNPVLTTLILETRALRKLDLQNNPLITNNSIFNPLSEHPYLERINVQGCPQVSEWVQEIINDENANFSAIINTSGLAKQGPQIRKEYEKVWKKWGGKLAYRDYPISKDEAWRKYTNWLARDEGADPDWSWKRCDDIEISICTLHEMRLLGFMDQLISGREKENSDILFHIAKGLAAAGLKEMAEQTGKKYVEINSGHTQSILYITREFLNLDLKKSAEQAARKSLNFIEDTIFSGIHAMEALEEVEKAHIIDRETLNQLIRQAGKTTLRKFRNRSGAISISWKSTLENKMKEYGHYDLAEQARQLPSSLFSKDW